MIPMRAEIEEICDSQLVESGELVQRVRLDSVKSIPVYVGLIGPTEARMIQIEFEREIKINQSVFKRFIGVEIQVLPSPIRDKNDFTIILLEKDLSDIFALFVDDILERIKDEVSGSEILSILNLRISHWRKLFAKMKGNLISEEAQRGLFGELYLLEQLLLETESKALVLGSWRGPLCEHQDFANGNTVVEAKTTKAGTPALKISSEHQLDYTCWEGLYLYLLVVNETTGGPDTLSEKMNNVISLFQNDHRLIEEFLMKLERIGVYRDTIDSYDEKGYVVRAELAFKVSEGFPLLVPGTLGSPSISKVKYEVELSSVSSFEIPLPELKKPLLQNGIK